MGESSSRRNAKGIRSGDPRHLSETWLLMAGDWIKMRVGLDRDPRVIRMADFLATEREFMDWLTDPVRRSCESTAYEHVTRNVTVALCVTGLLVTWGAAREQGDRDDDDLLIDHCDLDTISAIAGVPKFGDAMESVGWAHVHKPGSVVFPKFFKTNETPDEKHKRQAAERQASFRAKRNAESNVISNAESNVTVTHREEKRRVLKPSRALRSGLNGSAGTFDLFWRAYPRKKSKGDAEKAWAKIHPDEQLTEHILRAVEQAKTSADWRKDGGQFIPHPATWLNRRGWEDEHSLPPPTHDPNRLVI